MINTILNHIKLASQIKRHVIKIRINENEMKLIKILIQLDFIKFLYKPVIVGGGYDNYYYVAINTKNTWRFRSLYRPSAYKTLSYRELSKSTLLKKCTYVLLTNKGIITQNTAIKFKISGIMLMVLYV